MISTAAMPRARPALRLVTPPGRAVARDEPALDVDLVARARRGDAAAVDALFQRHAGHVLGMVTRLVGRSHDAEDVAQEALATALHELPALRDGAAFRAWLGQIAVRQAHRYFRRRRLRRLLGLDRGADDATLAALAAPDAPLEVRAELAALDAVLRDLPPAERIAWSLRYVEGEALEAVALACECSLATAKRRIAAASVRVRRYVNLAEDADG